MPGRTPGEERRGLWTEEDEERQATGGVGKKGPEPRAFFRKEEVREKLGEDLGIGVACWTSPVLQGSLPGGTRRQRVLERGVRVHLPLPAAGMLGRKRN